MLFQEIQIPLKVAPVLRCDNLSALALASNPVFHAHTKHIEVDYHFVCEKVLRRDLCVKFVLGKDNLADIFTKSLPSPLFLHQRCKRTVDSSPSHLRGDVKEDTQT